MKTYKFIIPATALLLSGATFAAEKAAAPDRPGREALFKQFDKNGDGELDADEREAARKAMQERAANRPQRGPDVAPPAENLSRENIVKRFDKNGDGIIDDAERAAAREEILKQREANAKARNEGGAGESRPLGAPGGFDRESLIKEFDKNKDGQLDETERAAVMAALRERRGMVRPEDPRREGAPARPLLDREELIKRFDTNGDGQLDDAERTAMRVEVLKRREIPRQPAGNDQ